MENTHRDGWVSAYNEVYCTLRYSGVGGNCVQGYMEQSLLFCFNKRFCFV